MKTEFRKSFVKDIKWLGKDEKLLGRIRDIILEVEAAASINAIANLKKMKAEGSYPHSDRQLPARPGHRTRHRCLCHRV